MSEPLSPADLAAYLNDWSATLYVQGQPSLARLLGEAAATIRQQEAEITRLRAALDRQHADMVTYLERLAYD